jgi:hypothetical protein
MLEGKSTEGLKRFVLLRGKGTGALYLFDRETYEYMDKSNSLEFVADNEDPEVLERYQALANEELTNEELTNVRKQTY